MSRAVAISILACKRHQHLRRALASALRYADELAEIIAVDNAAEPQLKSLPAAEYPTVRYLAAAPNAGCEGRNIGLRAAGTSIVVTLDDEVELGGLSPMDRRNLDADSLKHLREIRSERPPLFVKIQRAAAREFCNICRVWSGCISNFGTFQRHANDRPLMQGTGSA